MYIYVLVYVYICIYIYIYIFIYCHGGVTQSRSPIHVTCFVGADLIFCVEISSLMRKLDCKLFPLRQGSGGNSHTQECISFPPGVFKQMVIEMTRSPGHR